MLTFIRLAPPIAKNYYHDRSSSMSRVSSSALKDFQTYSLQQRPWQSNPDLRIEKWKPNSSSTLILNSSSANDSIDVFDVVKKKKLESEILEERAVEEESYRF